MPTWRCRSVPRVRPPADAALIAARLFLEQERPADAVRALRAAALGEVASVPTELIHATEALRSGWPEAAGGLLGGLDPAGLGASARASATSSSSWRSGSPGRPWPTAAAPEEAPVVEETVTMEETITAEPEPFDSALDLGAVLDLDLAFSDVTADTSPPEAPRVPAEPAEPAVTEPGGADPVLVQLRAEAGAAIGSERAGLLERLAGLLERAGETGAAADALIEALTADARARADLGLARHAGGGRPGTPGPGGPAARGDRRRGDAARGPARRRRSTGRWPPPGGPVRRRTPCWRWPTWPARWPPPPPRSTTTGWRSWAGWPGPSPGSSRPIAPRRRSRLRSPPASPTRPATGSPLPEAVGPLGKLLSLLTPHLEPLFPADLQRLGLTAAHRLVPPRAPEVLEPLEAAGALLSARTHATFLVDRPGALITVENTRPPALIVPAGFGALPTGARHFLATRTLDQLERGWALVGKFAPRDVGILLELACRFAGGKPPPLGLPEARAGAFLSAMARAVPPVVAARAASLGTASASQLAGIDLAALARLAAADQLPGGAAGHRRPGRRLHRAARRRAAGPAGHRGRRRSGSRPCWSWRRWPSPTPSSTSGGRW